MEPTKPLFAMLDMYDSRRRDSLQCTYYPRMLCGVKVSLLSMWSYGVRTRDALRTLSIALSIHQVVVLSGF